MNQKFTISVPRSPSPMGWYTYTAIINNQLVTIQYDRRPTMAQVRRDMIRRISRA